MPFGRGRDTLFMISGRKSEMMGADASSLVASSWMRMFLSSGFYFLEEI